MSNDANSKKESSGRTLWPRGLSGKLLILTVLFVMLAEVFIFVPSVANFRLTWLARHFDTGEAASLTLEKLSADEVPDDIREQLLKLTQTEAIIIRRDGASQVLAMTQMPREVARHIQLTQPGRIEAVRSIMDAFDTLFNGGDRVIRVYGSMEGRTGVLELIMEETPLREAMLSYARNVMLISLMISLVTAFLVFLSLRWFLIRPMQNMTNAMLAFSSDPENEENVIEPSGRRDEIGVAEEQLNTMQQQLRGTLKQQKNLADLGLAVSKINHDLRNILASASLFTDRLTSLSDPAVQRLAPRLIRTIDRAADYTRSVLAYGKAGEAIPERKLLRLNRVLEDVAEVLALDLGSDIEWVNQVPANFEVEADSDQLYRVLMNLCRNSVQIMSSTNGADHTLVKRLSVSAEQHGNCAHIFVSDTGPGIPPENKDKLFSAFQKSGRNGGTGLGLAIAAELIRAHGGTIQLVDSGGSGAKFEITLPSNSQSQNLIH